MRVKFNGYNFYTYLKNEGGLFASIDQEQIKKGLIICMEMPAAIDPFRKTYESYKRKSNPNYEPSPFNRYFACFSSFLNFFNWRRKIRTDRWFFHEVIRMQEVKTFFDIDLNCDASEYEQKLEELDEMLELIREHFNLYLAREKLDLISFEETALFTSSTRDYKEGKSKISAHFVIPKYSWESPLHLKCFVYKYILPNLGDFAEYVDKQVYSSQHNLRILGSLKGSRRKITQRVSIGYNKEDSLDCLQCSLITFCDDAIKLSMGDEMQSMESKTLSTDQLKEYGIDIQRVYKALGEVNSWGESVFSADRITEIGGRVKVHLSRRQKSYCVICNRVHEHENAFLIATKEEIFFKCLRNDSSEILLMEDEKIETITEVVPENHVNLQEIADNYIDTKRIRNVSDIEMSSEMLHLLKGFKKSKG